MRLPTANETREPETDLLIDTDEEKKNSEPKYRRSYAVNQSRPWKVILFVSLCIVLVAISIKTSFTYRFLIDDMFDGIKDLKELRVDEKYSIRYVHNYIILPL